MKSKSFTRWRVHYHPGAKRKARKIFTYFVKVKQQALFLDCYPTTKGATPCQKSAQKDKLRYLSSKAAKADRLINGTEPVLVTDVVLVKTLWTLKGKKYRLDKTALVDVLDSLFEEPNIQFEDDQTVWQAFSDYWKAKPVKVGNKKKEADFADALIVNKARFHASEKGNALNGVYTFDRAAQTISGTAAP